MINEAKKISLEAPINQRSSNLLTRRSFLKTVGAGTAVLVLNNLFTSDAYSAPQKDSQTPWISKDLVNEENPLISSGGRNNSLKIVATSSPEQIPLGSPVRYDVNMSVAQIANNDAPFFSGGFMLDGNNFGKFGPDTSRLVISRLASGVYVSQVQGTQSFQGEQITEDRELVNLILEIDPALMNVGIGYNNAETLINYNLKRPLIAEDRADRSLYMAAYSYPGIETTISRLIISLPQ